MCKVHDYCVSQAKGPRYLAASAVSGGIGNICWHRQYLIAQQSAGGAARLSVHTVMGFLTKNVCYCDILGNFAMSHLHMHIQPSPPNALDAYVQVCTISTAGLCACRYVSTYIETCIHLYLYMFGCVWYIHTKIYFKAGAKCYLNKTLIF